eukprot:PITA_03888
MVDEMTYLERNEVWDLVELRTGRKPIGNKWVFKKKMNGEGKVEKYKAHSVVKGYSQDSKLMKIHIPVGVKLSAEQCPKTQEEEEDMSRVPYASVVGNLMYAMVCTRPDIAHAVGVLSRFMSKSRKEHWATMKRVFKYLRGTSEYGLYYQRSPRLDIFFDIHGFFGTN